MDRVNIVSDPLFERFKGFMKSKDDIWKNDEWWNALELKLTYEYVSIHPLEESHLLTLGSLIALHIWRSEQPLIGTGKSRDHLIETIVYETMHLLNNPNAYKKMAFAHNPYGDGTACEKILKTLLTFAKKKHMIKNMEIHR